MVVPVRTKLELKKAIKNKEKEILITDPVLAKHIKNFKTIKKLTKGTLVALMAASGISAIGLALIPATGGTSATALTVPLVLYSFTVGTAAGTSATISTGAIVAIGCLFILGSAVLFALWKDYTVEIENLGPVANGIRLKRK